jgi:uncharacterized peroxidase-related enzyme
MNKISYLEIPDRKSLPDAVETLFQKFEHKLGMLPNMPQIFALTPEHFLKWFSYYDFLMRNEQSALSRREREMMALVVSSENKCEYCLATHSAYLRELTADAILPDVIIHNFRKADIPEREMRLLEFAHKVTTSSFAMNEADLQPLRDVGLTEATIFEAAQVAAMFNFTNRLANALGWKPNPEYYSMHR